MQVLSTWVTVIAIVGVVAYLMHPKSKAPEVLTALGGASADNIKALAGGV